MDTTHIISKVPYSPKSSAHTNAERMGTSIKAIVSGLAIATAGYAGPANAQIAISDHVETAAIINVAENLCDINFGDRLLHHVMLAASEMSIGIEAAAVLTDRRHAEIVSYLNQTRKLDEFCNNARAGKLR
ncbi:hypothetical protein [Maritimibacter sp. UBA3975]|uniref:hypothetical protein n=1 Tax=Maritimibacter sp. UBA3975 TaxID=1946833 RepID=UPI0025C32885|nr:hypothetical protein [Maritimibacter sp. UBA3975]|tara:strand:- start:1060 stop:1452 length:393 start_codon:yes stop_codon:yes gene_type:complete